MFQIRSHTAHVDIHFLKEKQVIGKMGRRLERQSYHYAGSYLITGRPKILQGLHPRVITVRYVSRMNLFIQFPGGTFYTPQVAAFADNQLLIQKNVRDDRTFTEIHTLDMNGRVEVLARMISGDKVTELSLANARELIEKSK